MDQNISFESITLPLMTFLKNLFAIMFGHRLTRMRYRPNWTPLGPINPCDAKPDFFRHLEEQPLYHLDVTNLQVTRHS